MHKNYRLLIILGILVAISVALGLYSGKKSSSNFRVDIFSIPDTSAIESIAIEGSQPVNLVRAEDGSWKVNDRFKVSPNLRNLLLSLLNQVTVRRPVSNIQKDEISEGLRDNKKVSINVAGETLSYYVGGNPARTQSYFMLADSDQPYIVEIPGYRNYLSGIFDLTEYQWRDRRLFNTHWRSLQSLKVSYPTNIKSDLNIYFENAFFKVERVSRLDTTALMEYLATYELFEANEFIPRGFSVAYDSLSQLEPLAIIDLEEINAANNQRLSIYPKLDHDDYILTSNKDGELSLTDFRRIRPFLLRPSDLRLD